MSRRGASRSSWCSSSTCATACGCCPRRGRSTTCTRLACWGGAAALLRVPPSQCAQLASLASCGWLSRLHGCTTHSGRSAEPLRAPMGGCGAAASPGVSYRFRSSLNAQALRGGSIRLRAARGDAKRLDVAAALHACVLFAAAHRLRRGGARTRAADAGATARADAHEPSRRPAARGDLRAAAQRVGRWPVGGDTARAFRALGCSTHEREREPGRLIYRHAGPWGHPSAYANA